MKNSPHVHKTILEHTETIMLQGSAGQNNCISLLSVENLHTTGQTGSPRGRRHI